LDEVGRQLLFTEARTVNNFSSEPVSDAELEAIWELAKWAPTAANTQPLRVVFVRTPEGKQHLLSHMNKGNVAKTAAAPVTAILAADRHFHEHMPTVLPHRPEMRDVLEGQEQVRQGMADFNATLQAAYFILAVRATGLYAGPMGGFDAEGVDREFFPDGRWHAILTVNIGHPGENPWFDRLPRLDNDDVLRWA
jgi:3-hydroxypropanoate dehydrogenase